MLQSTSNCIWMCCSSMCSSCGIVVQDIKSLFLNSRYTSISSYRFLQRIWCGDGNDKDNCNTWWQQSPLHSTSIKMINRLCSLLKCSMLNMGSEVLTQIRSLDLPADLSFSVKANNCNQSVCRLREHVNDHVSVHGTTFTIITHVHLILAFKLMKMLGNTEHIPHVIHLAKRNTSDSTACTRHGKVAHKISSMGDSHHNLSVQSSALHLSLFEFQSFLL